MTVSKYIGNDFGTMGIAGKTKQSSSKAITGIIFLSPDTIVAPTVGLTCLNTPDTTVIGKKVIDKDWWVAKTKAQNVFPFPQIVDYADASIAAKEYRYPAGHRKFVADSIKSFEFKFDVALEAHRAMKTFDNANLDFVLVEADGKVRFWNDGGNFRGFKSALIQRVMSTEVAADGGAPSVTGLMIDFANFRQWDDFGDFFYPEWDANTLEALTPAHITTTQVGITKVITVTVGSNGGYNTTTGEINYIPIQGLTKEHFLVKNAAGDVQTLVSSVMGEKGVYTVTLPTTTTANTISVTLQQIAVDLAGDSLLDPISAASVAIVLS